MDATLPADGLAAPFSGKGADGVADSDIGAAPGRARAEWRGSSGLPRSRMLVLGDSTAVGTGAPPEMSVAARLARAYLDVSIDNRGADGASLADTLGQLQEDEGPAPLMMLIMSGGNDVFRMATVRRMERHLDRLLEAAIRRAPRVVLMSPGNFASAPGLWWPLDGVMGWRSRVARDAFRRIADRHPILHVSLFREAREDPFAQDPARFYADDGVHTLRPRATGSGSGCCGSRRHWTAGWRLPHERAWRPGLRRSGLPPAHPLPDQCRDRKQQVGHDEHSVFDEEAVPRKSE